MFTIQPISAPSNLNEAPSYGSAFSRALLIEGRGVGLQLISGTASIGPNGETLHVGDFKAQVQQTYDNISALLWNGGMLWNNVVRITTYLRDIDRDYKAFNEVRNEFFAKMGLPFPPAATCIEAKLCRPELLVEMEVIAVADLV
jgi:enamine deaminase RidA (YjgF/YER057c/UK114 family)